MKGKWTKSPPALVALFDAALAGKASVERRQMFGYPAAFLGGNLITGLFQDHMMVRLSEADRAKALAEGGVPFAPGGRPMREYIVLPNDVIADKRRLGVWLRRAIAYGETLPAKKPKRG
jgi:TfoX/Sxy family transcriptional regulator of competence genes